MSDKVQKRWVRLAGIAIRHVFRREDHFDYSAELNASRVLYSDSPLAHEKHGRPNVHSIGKGYTPPAYPARYAVRQVVSLDIIVRERNIDPGRSSTYSLIAALNTASYKNRPTPL